MTESTIKLLFAGALALGGLTAMLVTTLVGMSSNWSVEQIMAINIVFSNVVMAGLAFFFGHQNGYKNGYKNGGSKQP
ncbi:hypothetical protein LCGC14_1720860 [marine sediment metagenome]|uniref:Uncharacterized protein n=1 Tax=marine sediment metagenome TaxID=412755 RepID=A0A0F9KC79_9ZZZZ